MTLNLTQLKDLEHICWLAEDYFQISYGLTLENEWRERVRTYRRLLKAEIERLQFDGPAPDRPEPLFDPARKDHPESNILVRCRFPDGSYGTTDLAHLTKESFFLWLRSTGGENPWAEACVAHLLGYEVE